MNIVTLKPSTMLNTEWISFQGSGVNITVAVYTYGLQPLSYSIWYELYTDSKRWKGVQLLNEGCRSWTIPTRRVRASRTTDFPVTVKCIVNVKSMNQIDPYPNGNDVKYVWLRDKPRCFIYFLKLINNFMSHFTGHAIAFPCGDKSWSMVVKRAKCVAVMTLVYLYYADDMTKRNEICRYNEIRVTILNE